MLPVIYELKREVLELERASYANDPRQMALALAKVKALVEKVETENEKHCGSGIEYKRINKLPFLYKPLMRADFFRGDYLERFAAERTMQLKEADALGIHNTFWRSHEDVKGNVFGSVPVDMLSPKAAEKLDRLGWKRALVNVIDLKDQSVEEKMLARFCEKTFDHFILVREKATDTYLVLEYEL